MTAYADARFVRHLFKPQVARTSRSIIVGSLMVAATVSCTAPVEGVGASDDASSSAGVTEVSGTAGAPVSTALPDESEEDPRGPVYASCFGNEGLVVYVLDVDTGKTTDIASFPSYGGGGFDDCLEFRSGSDQELRPNFNSDFTRVAVSRGVDGIGYLESGSSNAVAVSERGESDDPFVATLQLSDPAFDSDDNLVAGSFKRGNTEHLTFDVDSGQIVGTVASSAHPAAAAVRLPVGSTGCSIRWKVGESNTYLRLAQSTTGDESVWKWDARRQLGEGEQLSYLDDGCVPGVGEKLSPESENPIGDLAADPSGDIVFFSVAPKFGGDGQHSYFVVQTGSVDPSSPRELVMHSGARPLAGPIIDWI